MNDAAARLAGLRNWAQLVYALHALSIACGVLGYGTITGRFLFGLPSVIAVVLTYARRAEAQGTWLATHAAWQLHTFWRALLWCVVTLVVCAPLLILVIGAILAPIGLGLVGLWVCYRVLRGWLALRAGQPMPAVPA